MSDVIAPMCVGDERFRSIRSPFHRPGDFSRGPEANDFLWINENLRAEPAADIRRDDTKLVFGRHADKGCDHQARYVRVLRGVPKRELLGPGIVFGKGNARLYRIRNQTIVDDVEEGHVLSGCKGRIDCFGGAKRTLIDRVLWRNDVYL